MRKFQLEICLKFRYINAPRKNPMITINSNLNSNPIKAVGLLSGGLDSTLAAKIVHDLGIEVHGIYFAMPWGCCNKAKAMEVAEQLGIKFTVLQLDEQYLEVVKKPKHGYGSALNPCVDCRVHMFSRAQKYMNAIGAQFVFTGEVLGQRPMSQRRDSMRIIEKESHLEGLLLRPLSAHLLDPTIPEEKGWVNRDKLLSFSGRSRSEQIQLAKELGVTDYLPPAGGCLLTDKNFARRMQDSFNHGYRNFRETIALKWGRHFRLAPEFKAVLGRDQEENESLRAFAHLDDYIFELPDKIGPTLVLKGLAPGQDILQTCAGLIQRFSRHKDLPQIEVDYWLVKNKNHILRVQSRKISEEEINRILI